jgi:citrate synthase
VDDPLLVGRLQGLGDLAGDGEGLFQVQGSPNDPLGQRLALGELVGSSQADLFASISAGICALWGPLHGGANQRVIEMLERIQRDGGDYGKYVAMAKDKESGFRLMGFGHRVYKNFDPRATILREAAAEVLEAMGRKDPLLEIARNLERIALEDEFFVERKLYPNVDFYSGILYRAMGIPTDMFTVMFALGLMPGWIAQWKEMRENPAARIYRPRQIYIGATERDLPGVTPNEAERELVGV